ncbi:MAG: AmmeMemoRadiSam system protein A [Bacilli bacterium]|nr:AmmeMemoRadiSam system protein A [Bacilli bacterium]
MPIIGSYILPHPPFSVPEVGRGKERVAEKTVAALDEVAKEIASLAPDTIVFISPHSEAYRDFFPISDGEVGIGNFTAYGAPGLSFRLFYDRDLVKEIASAAAKRKIAAGPSSGSENTSDHGTLVPLYYINRYYRNFKAVRLGLSGFPLLEHYRYGEMLGDVFSSSEKKIVVIASADLSHCQRADGPYGFRVEGPRYDEMVEKIIETGNFGLLLSMDRSLVTKARECGHRSILVLAGMLDRQEIKSTIISHEAPYGIGYLVAKIETLGFDASRAFSELYRSKEEFSINEDINKSDLYVKWARQCIETYIKTKKLPPMEEILPDNFLKTKAGVFVTIHEHGELRGCLGSVKALKDNLGQEIAHNAVSAATCDSRFSPIKEEDFPYLKITVDVLSNPIPILSIMDLDVAKYGIIVENGDRKGVVLPGLSGIETPDQQIAVAKRKAGIDQGEEITLYRFEVKRHQ